MDVGVTVGVDVDVLVGGGVVGGADGDDFGELGVVVGVSVGPGCDGVVCGGVEDVPGFGCPGWLPLLDGVAEPGAEEEALGLVEVDAEAEPESEGLSGALGRPGSVEGVKAGTTGVPEDGLVSPPKEVTATATPAPRTPIRTTPPAASAS